MARYTIVPDRSRVTATARSSVHPIQVRANYVTGTVDADIVDGAIDLTNPPQVTITMELADLHADNSMYDSELKRRIDAQRYPTITGMLTEMATGAASGKYTARGDLTMHGATSTVDGTATLRVTESGLEASGELDLDIRDFGLAPPRILMLRVYPEVHVEIELVTASE